MTLSPQTPFWRNILFIYCHWLWISARLLGTKLTCFSELSPTPLPDCHKWEPSTLKGPHYWWARSQVPVLLHCTWLCSCGLFLVNGYLGLEKVKIWKVCGPNHVLPWGDATEPSPAMETELWGAKGRVNWGERVNIAK